MTREAIEVVATFRSKPGCADELEQLIREVLPLVRAEEGCLRYDFYRVSRDEDEFVMLERYASRDAMKAHASAPHSKTMFEQVADLVEGQTSIKVLRAVEPEQSTNLQ